MTDSTSLDTSSIVLVPRISARARASTSEMRDLDGHRSEPTRTGSCHSVQLSVELLALAPPLLGPHLKIVPEHGEEWYPLWARSVERHESLWI